MTTVLRCRVARNRRITNRKFSNDISKRKFFEFFVLFSRNLILAQEIFGDAFDFEDIKNDNIDDDDVQLDDEEEDADDIEEEDDYDDEVNLIETAKFSFC